MNSKDALLCHHGTCLDYTEGEMDGENFCRKIWPFFPKIGLINFKIITLDSKCFENFEIWWWEVSILFFPKFHRGCFVCFGLLNWIVGKTEYGWVRLVFHEKPADNGLKPKKAMLEYAVWHTWQISHGVNFANASPLLHYSKFTLSLRNWNFSILWFLSWWLKLYAQFEIWGSWVHQCMESAWKVHQCMG